MKKPVPDSCLERKRISKSVKNFENGDSCSTSGGGAVALGAAGHHAGGTSFTGEDEVHLHFPESGEGGEERSESFSH